MTTEIQLSRQFGYLANGPLVNDATVFADDPVSGNRTASTRRLEAPQPLTTWSDADYLAAFVAHYPTCTVTLAPPPDA